MAVGQSERVNMLTSYQDLSSHPIGQSNRYRLLLPLGRYRRDGEVGAHSAFSINRNKISLRRKAFLIIFCVLFSCLLVSPAFGQEAKGLNQIKPINIGHRVPDGFWSQKHLFYINGDTVRKTLEEHKGKMIVLDFWFSGCAPCLMHQKDIRSFTDKYADRLVVIMVNSKITKEAYQTIAASDAKGRFSKYGIESLTSIIEDDYLQSLFPYTSFPHYVWINPEGRVQLRTFRNLLDSVYVAPFIDGGND